MLSRAALLVRSIPLSDDTQVRVQALEVAAAGNQLVLDVRLYRRCRRGEVGFCSTSEGFRVPLHLSGKIADEVRHVALRAAEQLAIAPPGSPS
jgi:hypothetical protein